MSVERPTSLVELLTQLRRLDVRVWVDGDRLRLSAPKGAVSPDLQKELVSRKGELIAALSATPDAVSGAGSIDHTAPSRDGSYVAPLSSAQERMWFFEQLGSSAANQLTMALRFDGVLHTNALREALDGLVRRHESLRTTFSSREDGPVQTIAATGAIAFELKDAGSPAEADAALAAEAKRPFDLERGPLLRALLLVLGPQQHILSLTIHHIISDGWSLGVMLRELSTLYDAAVHHTDASLPPVPTQYANYARRQREQVAGGALARRLEYWRTQLRGTLPVLALPTDHPRPPVDSHRGERITVMLSAISVRELEALARREQATLFMVLLTAFTALLTRYTGQEDVIVGTPVSGRSQPEWEPLIGLFVNTLVLRTDTSGDPEFLALLGRVRDTSVDAYENADVPLERLVEELRPVRDPSRNPLFQAMFDLQKTAPPPAFVGLTMQPVAVDRGAAQFDITLSIVTYEGRLHAQWEYNTDLFDRTTIEQFARHYEQLLASAVADPTQSLSQLSLLTPADEAASASGPVAAAAGRAALTLHARFEDQVARTPDAIAVTGDAGALTYADLNRRANRLAHRLRELGVHRDTLVGLCAERSLELIVGVVGILKAGGAYVPIDLSSPRERVAFLIEDAAVPVFVTQRAVLDSLPPVAAATVFLDDPLAGYPETNPTPTVEPDDLAYVIYTSGSTGVPKGTMVTHRAVDRLFGATDAWFHFGATDVWTLFHSIAFDFSVWELWGPLLTGGRLVVVPFLVSRTPEAVLELLRAEGVTVLNQTPSAFTQLIAADVAGGRPPLTQLRCVIFGGEKLALPSLRPWVARYGDTMPTLVNMYGITETCVHVTYRRLTRQDIASEAGSPIGVPIPDLRVYLLDAHRRLVPLGVPGEVYVGGPGLARGYLHRPELTAERFVNDPFLPGQRLYRSGDLARRRASGDLEYLGRIDTQVKLRGFRIELGEIEAAIAHTPGVRQCAVALREDRRGDPRLVAYVDCTGPRETVHEAVRAHLAVTLPDYMRPTAFVFLDALPLTANGKIDRRALPAPEDEAGRSMRDTTPPATATEQALAQIWQDVLDVRAVGRDDNFFELGGHSLLATRLASRIRSTFECEFALRALFETPVLAALARHIDAAVADRAAPGLTEIARIAFDGPVPLSFSQERMWVLHQMDPMSPAYNIPAAVQLRGPLDRAALERALTRLVSRHEALRTTYSIGEGGDVVQVVQARQVVPLAFDDLRTLGAGARTQAIERMTNASRVPFDLARGPVLKATLLRVADEEHFLLLSMHHIAGDQWALGVLGRELALAYNAYRQQVEPRLPALPIRYRDFAVWQRESFQGAVLQEQLAYWRKQMAGAPPVLELPADFVRPPVASARGAVHIESFPRELSDALNAFSREHRCTLTMTLLAAFVTLLHRYSGQDDITVAMPIANREQVAVEPLVGLFVNTLVLRTACPDDLSFVDLLRRVRETALDAFAHQALPFEKLVDELRLERDVSRTPLAQVLFNVQNAPVAGTTFDELTAEAVLLDRGGSQFDLGFAIDTVAMNTILVEYNTDIFATVTVARFASRYRVLLESILADPTRSLGTLPIVTPAEAASTLPSLPPVEMPTGDGTVHAGVEEQARRTPEARAVTFGATSLTYDALNRRANRLAHRLRGLGVAPGTLVGVGVERSLDLLVSLLGILKAGGAYVPIDLAYPADRVAFVLGDAGASVLVTQRALAERFAGQAATAVFVDDDLAAYPDTNPEPRATPDALAYVIYTSGSTGQPKGVEVAHRNVVSFLAAMRATPGCTAADVLLAVTTVAFDIAGLELWLPLSVGAHVVLAARSDAVDGERLGALIAQHGVTLLQATPATWRLLLDAGWAGTPTLTALCGGEALPRDLAAALVPRVRALWNMYGPTETTIWSTLSPITDAAAPITIGRPIAGTRVYVVEPSGQLAPAGVPGELCIAGAGVARGYHHRPELTAEKFTALPLPDGRTERVYHTGDIVRARPDGALEYRGRRDQQIKLRGYRIELGEIEAVLATHPGVAAAAVALRDDPTGDSRLVAYIVTDSNMPVDTNAARAALRAKLPEYMVPNAFMVLAELPLTPNGKVDRTALPVPVAPPQERAIVADVLMTPSQRRVADIWQNVLHTDRVGLNDNFFDVGGHSLLLIKLHAALKTEFHVDMTVVELFQHTTVASQAARVASTGPTDAAVRRAQARAARQIDG